MPPIHLKSPANVKMTKNLSAVKAIVTGGRSKAKASPVCYTFDGMESMACWNFALFGSQELKNLHDQVLNPINVSDQAPFKILRQTYTRRDVRDGVMKDIEYIQTDYSKVCRRSAPKKSVIKSSRISELKKTFTAALKEKDDGSKFATNQAKYHRLYTEIHAELAGWEISRKKPSRSGWLRIRCMSREWTTWHHWCLVWKMNKAFHKAYHWYAESFPTMTTAQCGMTGCNDQDFPYTEVYAIGCPETTVDAFKRFKRTGC